LGKPKQPEGKKVEENMQNQKMSINFGQIVRHASKEAKNR
jgi:hypothetical protein